MSAFSREDLKAIMREVLNEQTKSGTLKINDKAIKEHAMHCPDCFGGIISDMNKKSDYVCESCGLPLGDLAMTTALDKCPNCGGRNPKKNPFKEY